MIKEAVISVVFLLFFGCVGILVYKTSMLPYPTVQPYITKWKTPDIPQCDKELWDRIREGCDEQRESDEDSK